MSKIDKTPREIDKNDEGGSIEDPVIAQEGRDTRADEGTDDLTHIGEGLIIAKDARNPFLGRNLSQEGIDTRHEGTSSKSIHKAKQA